MRRCEGIVANQPVGLAVLQQIEKIHRDQPEAQNQGNAAIPDQPLGDPIEKIMERKNITGDEQGNAGQIYGQPQRNGEQAIK